MSTIKSSAENLTLNADGANNDIKFQSNGVEKASIDQDGLVTCAGSTMSGALTVNSGANLAFKVNGTTYTQLWQTLQSVNDLTLKTTADKFISFQPNSVEKVRIHSSGVTSFNNGIELGSGLDATAANTLNDYEEGTFTPVFGFAGGTLTKTDGAIIWGSYTKIGNVVTFQIMLHIASSSGGSGNFELTGMPFAAGSGYMEKMTAHATHLNAFAWEADWKQVMLMNGGSATVWLLGAVTDDLSYTTCVEYAQRAHIPTGNFYYHLTGHYYTDS